MFAAEIRRKRVQQMRAYSNWRWLLDEVFVKINGEMHYLWRAMDHEGEVLESYVSKRWNRKAALRFLRKKMKRHGHPHILVTDKLRSYGAAMKGIGNAGRQETGRWKTTELRIHTCRFDDENGPCSGSAACEVYSNSLSFMPLSTTISIRYVTSTTVTISNLTEARLSPSGASFVA